VPCCQKYTPTDYFFGESNYNLQDPTSSVISVIINNDNK